MLSCDAFFGGAVTWKMLPVTAHSLCPVINPLLPVIQKALTSVIFVLSWSLLCLLKTPRRPWQMAARTKPGSDGGFSC